HDTKIIGHIGAQRTLEKTPQNFYWLGMKETEIKYVSASHEDPKDKPRRHRAYGKLQPFETAYAPWTSISWDFITRLLEVNHAHSTLWIIVICFTKMADVILLQTHHTTAQELPQILIKELR